VLFFGKKIKHSGRAGLRIRLTLPSIVAFFCPLKDPFRPLQ